MDLLTAKRLVRNVTYKPTWSFTFAEDHSSLAQWTYGFSWDGEDRYLETLGVFDAPDSAREMAPHYGPPTSLAFLIQIDLIGVKTDDEFYQALFAQIVAKEVHEAREFFRLKDRNYDAPFHPHTYSGKRVWAQAASRELAQALAAQ